MKAQELRLGNYTQDQDGNVLVVDGLESDKIDFKVVDRSKFPLKDGWKAEPIPINQDWLKKAGFEYAEGLRMLVMQPEFELCGPDDYEDSVYHHIFFYHSGDSFGFEVSNEWGETGNAMLSKIKYVHQLQNLYFALTGEELRLQL